MVAKDEWGKALSVTKQTSEIVLRTLNKTPEHMMSLLAKRAKDEAEARMEKLRVIRQKEMQERVKKEKEGHDKVVADREAKEFLERIQSEYAANRPRSKQDYQRPRIISTSTSTELKKTKLQPLASKRN
jgi:ribosomal protein L24